MQPDSTIISVAHVIQLAVAPVFLLTGIGAILGVLINRLGRVIDRTRLLENRLQNAEPGVTLNITNELFTLSKRSRLINWAISLCTFAALLICIVIAALFVGAFLIIDVSGVVALLFIAAMLALIGGLINFLREIYQATNSMRIKSNTGK